jgi:DNA ligase D-like protein (predicted ligase)
MTARVTKPAAKALPVFIPPMLAKLGTAFDSDQHLFEIKWDGTRTLAFLGQDGYRLLNRRRLEMTARYPEFAFLAELPEGLVLDGEMVVLKNGKPDFGLLQSREHSRARLKVRTLARTLPATYIVFDLLYEKYQSLMDQPLLTRRERLRELVQHWQRPQIVLSEGVIGPGQAYFREVVGQGLEGVIAKRLESRYMPGKRTDAWIKIKRGDSTICAVIGFLPSGANDFRSLILATEGENGLHYAGKVGTGFDRAMRARLNRWLWSHLQEKPMVRCTTKGKWVCPGLYCQVRFMERTAGGEFRAPVFAALLVEE